jgi:hypothetical protein
MLTQNASLSFQFFHLFVKFSLVPTVIVVSKGHPYGQLYRFRLGTNTEASVQSINGESTKKLETETPKCLQRNVHIVYIRYIL